MTVAGSNIFTMPNYANMRRWLSVASVSASQGLILTFVMALLVAAGWSADTRHKPVRAWDLRQFGYLNEGVGDYTDYTNVGFLSEDLLLVAINQRPFENPQPLFADTPDGILVLLDISNGKALRTAHMPMFKFLGSMAPVLEGRFLVLTLSEVQLCSTDFVCDRSFSTKGPLLVSSDRDKVVVGGNLMTPQVVLDSRTLAPVAEGGHEAVKISAERPRQYRRDGSFTESISSVDGQRFVLVENKQTLWNKLTNPLAGLGDPIYNSRRITVYDKRTEKELFTLQWDPRHKGGGATTEPALSPTGHRVAILGRGIVEVFEVP